MTAKPQSSTRPPVHWLSVGQFGLSLLAIALLWSLAGSIALAGLVSLFDPTLLPEYATSLFLMAAGIGFVGMLLLPSVFFSFIRLTGRQSTWPEYRIFRWLRPTVLILFYPLVLVAGAWINQNTDFAWLLLPPIHVLAVLLPIWWLVYLASRGLPKGSPQRAWGVLDSGLVLGPALILVFEVMIFGFFMLLVGVYLFTRPDIEGQLLDLLQSMSQTTPTPDLMLEKLRPFLLQPVVIYAVVILGAVLVPIVEEFLKPIGVWLLAGTGMTPVGGFVAGVLSGAGFALFESLAYTSNAEGWAFAVVARIGTAVMHISTAGLVGWALALTWRQRNFLKLGLAYLAAVLIHGLWNGVTLVGVGVSLFTEVPQQPSFLYSLGGVAPLALIFLTVSLFIFLLWTNFQLRKHIVSLQQTGKSVL